MSSRKRSLAWDYFSEIDGSGSVKKVKCSLCNCTLKYDGCRTSGMIKHLNCVHRSALGIETSSASIPSSQKTLEDVGVTTKRNCPSSRQEVITNLIVDTIADNNLPLHFTESTSFRKLLACVEPRYKVPCYETVKSRLKAKKEKISSIIKSKLETVDYVALTTDAWTSLSNDSFLAVTAAYITDEWIIEAPVLETINLQERHTASYLSEELKIVTVKWEIHEKVVAVVHDNGANVGHIAELCSEDYIDVPCAAHTLQLAIGECMGTNAKVAVNPIARMINAASRLVGHFSHSSSATQALKKKQALLNTDEGNQQSEQSVILNLIQHCKTRWNSIHDMLERLLKLRFAISATLGDTKITKKK